MRIAQYSGQHPRNPGVARLAGHRHFTKQQRAASWARKELTNDLNETVVELHAEGAGISSATCWVIGAGEAGYLGPKDRESSAT